MRIDQIWRYPVKSVGGERLTAAAVGPLGMQGDRVVAVRDARGEVTWAGAVPALMRLRAVTTDVGVDLVLPDGQRVPTDSPDVGHRLASTARAGLTLTPHRPDDPDAALHVLTTASMDSLAGTLPDSAIDVSRFRPNIVLDGAPDESGTGYPEHGWTGRRMALGPVRLRFTKPCERCVMITRETPTVPPDRAVLRWVARELGNTLGAYAAVETGGTIRVGDEARWLD